MITPESEPSAIPFPNGPTYPSLLDSDERIAWVRFKVWTADWYTRVLGELGAEHGGYDRHIGIEMALDGALSSLSAAFDASVVLMIESAEEALQASETDRLAPHKYGWDACRKKLNRFLLTTNGLPHLCVDVDKALAGAKTERPTGWLAVLRRLRNRATHHTTLPRNWVSDDVSQTAIGFSDIPDLNPFEYLKESCDRVSELTERMLRIANEIHYIGARTPLRRTRWASS